MKQKIKCTFNLYLKLCIITFYIISSSFNTLLPVFNKFLNSVLASPIFVTQTCFPHFLLKLPYPMCNCAYYINTCNPIHNLHMAMSMGGIFSAVKNSIMACCLNRMSSQPSILTGTEPELWRAVGSRLHTVEGRYIVTAWNRFYQVSSL